MALPGSFVVAALQRVLHLQLQVRGQPGEPDPLMAGDPGACASTGRRTPRRAAVRAVSRSRRATGTSRSRARPTARSCRPGSPQAGPRGGARQRVQPALQVRHPGSFPRAGVASAQALAAGDAVSASRCPAAGQRGVLPPRGSAAAANPVTSGLPAAAHRCRCPWHRPWPRAARSHPVTRHSFPPNTGSRGSKTSSSARNSGRTAAISFSSRPAGAWRCPSSAASGPLTGCPPRRRRRSR